MFPVDYAQTSYTVNELEVTLCGIDPSEFSLNLYMYSPGYGVVTRRASDVSVAMGVWFPRTGRNNIR